MESFYSVVDYLRPRGLDFLTGESCAYGLRMLFDATPEMMDKLAEFMGAVEITGASAWNGQRGTTQSVMLGRGVVRDFVVYLLVERHEMVIRIEGTSRDGLHPGSEYYAGTAEEMQATEKYLSREGIQYRRFYGKSGPRKGGRMVHAMSGRAE